MANDRQNAQSATWLQRIIRRFHRQGDLIAAEIGDQVSGVVVGKNIIQIGTVKIPLWMAAVVLIAVLAGVGIVSLNALSTQAIGGGVRELSDFVRTPTPTPPPRMPDGRFNIAVAEFAAGELDQSAARDSARELSHSIANFLDNQEDALTEILKTQVTIWGPDRGIAAVEVGNEAARAAALNAHVLIFGSLQAGDSERWRVQPKFFLTDKSVGQADELSGEHSLGSAVTFRPDNLAAKGEVNATLRMRLDALIQVLLGLSYMTFGDLDGYQKAAQVLQATTENSEWAKAGEPTGQEILYLFLGNAYLGQSFLTHASTPLRQDLLLKSQAAFSEAIARNENYARSYNGLGSTLFQLARPAATEDECAWDWELLQAADEHFMAARNVPPDARPPSGQVEYRASFGLGRVRFWQGYCLEPARWEEALALYQSVVDTYATLADPLPNLIDIAAYAHTDMGFMQFFQADLALQAGDAASHAQGKERLGYAVTHYTQAMALAQRSGTEEGRAQRRAVMPYYLTVLCLDGQQTQAEIALDDFLQAQVDPESLRSDIVQRINPDIREECKL